MLPDHLKTILTEGVLESPSSGNVVLKEPNVQEVEVSRLVSDAVVIRLRKKFGRFSGIKDGRWTQKCDYMIVFSGDENNCVLFVELKNALNNKKRAFAQLRRSLPLLKYFDSVCGIHFGCGTGKPEMTVRYVLISAKNSHRFDKQSVRPTQLRYTDEYKDITVTTLIGSRFRFDLLWDVDNSGGV